MIYGFIIILLTALFAHVLSDYFFQAGTDSNRLAKQLFWYHLLISSVYFLYVTFNPSDSKAYFSTSQAASSWFELYGTSTTFIKFIAYPFIKYLSFTYEAAMALFSFIGYCGFLFFLLAIKQLLKFNPKLFGFDLLKLILFLPNLHFWSASLGKGSLIFFSIALFFWSLVDPRRRWMPIMLSSILIYHVRPHIMLMMLVCYAVGFIFSTKGLPIAWRIVFLAGAVVAFFFIYKDVLTLVGIDEDQFLTQGLDLTHRAKELGKATSGVNINQYSLPLQVFTFLYRPLFFDAPGALGIFVSIENVFYLLLTIYVFSQIKSWSFVFKGDYMVKGSLLSFLTISIALAQVSGNLGLAIRQKSQVMMLFLFVMLAFLNNESMKTYIRMKQKRKRTEKRGVAI
jgi:hypothetical protein